MSHISGFTAPRPACCCFSAPIAGNMHKTQISEGTINRGAVEELVQRGAVKEGDLLILTKGDFTGVAGGTNAMKIVTVGKVA